VGRADRQVTVVRRRLLVRALDGLHRGRRLDPGEQRGTVVDPRGVVPRPGVGLEVAVPLVVHHQHDPGVRPALRPRVRVLLGRLDPGPGRLHQAAGALQHRVLHGVRAEGAAGGRGTCGRMVPVVRRADQTSAVPA
jgi:hypothetical protein